MAALLEKIRANLKESTSDWDWDFAYAPRPGQQRIRITAINRKNPEQRKVMILAEDLFKKLPLPPLARNIVRLLPTLPEESSGPSAKLDATLPRPMASVEKSCSARDQYRYMRKGYHDSLVTLQAQVLSQRRNDWSGALARGFQRIKMQLSRKAA